MPQNIMGAVVAALKADPVIQASFAGKIHADEADPVAADVPGVNPFPYILLDSTPQEKFRRTFGGWKIGHGSFYLGVYDLSKDGAVLKLQYAIHALERLPLQGSPVALGDGGSWYYCRAADNSARALPATTPSGDPAYCQVAQIHYQVTRPDPA